MLERVFYTIGALLRFSPFMLLGYISVTDRLKISKKQLAFCLLGIICMIVLVINIAYPVKDGWWYPCFSIFVILYLFFYIYSVNQDFRKSFFLYLCVTHLGSFIIGTTNYLFMMLRLSNPRFARCSAIYDAIYLGVFIVTMPVIIHILYCRVKPILKLNNSKVWRNLWTIPAIYTLSYSAFCVATTRNILSIWQYMLITLSLNYSAYIVYLMTFKMILQTEENAALRESAKTTALQLSFEEEQYKNLGNSIEKARAARHDLRHHLSVIRKLIDAKDIENLNLYVIQYMQSIPDNTQLMVCENCAVNAIVQHYLEIAGKQGIKTTVELHIPQELSASGIDLCIVFGNLIENAIEACARMEPDLERYIRIYAKLQGRILGITIDNSFDGQLNIKNKKILSRKRNGEEGVGLSSVRAVAEKYHGHVEMNVAGKEFQFSLMLNLP